MAKIVKIGPDSVLSGILKIGDEILSFNGRPFLDVLDYIYADALSECIIRYRSDEKEHETIVRKEYDCDTFGLEFDESIEITPIECCNNCIFCFVHQLPQGMRETLYVRDDDYRLSFVSGSYITCTNLREKDFERILTYRLSPLYVSVHTTDEPTRLAMLGIKRAENITDILRRFIDGGIEIHAQIVLVPGVNDGLQLEKSLRDMKEIGVSTVAVVPAGLTKHRKNLPVLRAVDRGKARETVEITERLYREYGGFCYVSDEMYERAMLSPRDAEYYGNYEQIENGVGLVPKFLSELEDALSDAPKRCKRKIAVLTGISGAQTMRCAKVLVEGAYPKSRINIYPVPNQFFGESVTVSGLVTASDILKAYGGKEFSEDYIVIPSVMLREFTHLFLDGMSTQELSERLGKKILVSDVTGEAFLETILYGDK